MLQIFSLMKYHNFKKNLLAFCFGLTLILLLLELVFTFIFPASNTPELVYDDTNHLLKFKPGNQGVSTIGAWAEQPYHWQINQAGWNSTVEYDTTDRRPLIAIIGDSYIQAVGADIEKSYPSLLRNQIGAKYRMYQFGVSGSPMSQYLNVSRYVQKTYHPQIMIFNIVHNDFLETLKPFTSLGKGFMCLDSTTFKEEYLSPKHFSTPIELSRKSHLIRYLMRNLSLGTLLGIEYNVVKKTSFDQPLKNKISQAVDTVLTRIQRENTITKLVFVMDTPRPEIETNEFENSPFWWTHELMKVKTESKKMLLLDLTDAFKADFKKNKVSFQTKIDNHWNNYGHQKVFDALYPFLVKEKVIE